MRFGSGGVGRIHNRKSRPRASGLPATSLWSFLHAPAGYTPRTTGWAMKKADIAAFFDRLAAALPEPKGELEYVNAYTLLVAVVLSAQATDVGVNRSEGRRVGKACVRTCRSRW